MYRGHRYAFKCMLKNQNLQNVPECLWCKQHHNSIRSRVIHDLLNLNKVCPSLTEIWYSDSIVILLTLICVFQDLILVGHNFIC